MKSKPHTAACRGGVILPGLLVLPLTARPAAMPETADRPCPICSTPVTRIRTQAFQDLQDIRFVDLSGCGNLQEIRANAFHICGSLEAVDLSGCPDLKEIADFAFDSCTSLERLYLCGSAGSLISVSSTAFSQDVIIYVEDEAEKNRLLGVLYVPGIVEICPEKHPHSSFPSP